MNRVRLLAGLLLVLCAVLTGSSSTLATGTTYKQIATLTPSGNLPTSFDISWVDRSTQTYFLADRTNAGVDEFNAENNLFVTSFGGFVGFTGNNDFSGPDGVLVVHPEHELWAGDGDSTVKVFDLKTGEFVTSISTGGVARTDEMAFDQADHVILAANDADDPPFVSFIDVKTHELGTQIPFDQLPFPVNGQIQVLPATNGIEQPLWDPVTHRFYVATPQIGSDPLDGGIVVINPDTQSIEQVFPVRSCQPHGLALGPHQHILLGCSGDAIAAGAPAQSIVMDARDGSIVATITQVGGSDEVWFNPGDKRYYLAANKDKRPHKPTSPVLGVIDAETNTWLTSVPTGANAHSVAVDPINDHVFVPISGKGIAVFVEVGR